MRLNTDEDDYHGRIVKANILLFFVVVLCVCLQFEELIQKVLLIAVDLRP